jgi:hypothetical protein
VLLKEEITPEEDEEQLIMRRLRNSVDELRREFRLLDYRMQKIKGKADQAKDARERIELHEDKVGTAIVIIHRIGNEPYKYCKKINFLKLTRL